MSVPVGGRGVGGVFAGEEGIGGQKSLPAGGPGGWGGKFLGLGVRLGAGDPGVGDGLVAAPEGVGLLENSRSSRANRSVPGRRVFPEVELGGGGEGEVCGECWGGVAGAMLCLSPLGERGVGGVFAGEEGDRGTKKASRLVGREAGEGNSWVWGSA
jgi:hypothetical protein